jgi:hypothetical protein
MGSSPLGLATRRNEWIGLDVFTTIFVETCFQTPERGCASIERHPKRRPFPSYLKAGGG